MMYVVTKSKRIQNTFILFSVLFLSCVCLCLVLIFWTFFPVSIFINEFLIVSLADIFIFFINGSNTDSQGEEGELRG